MKAAAIAPDEQALEDIVVAGTRTDEEAETRLLLRSTLAEVAALPQRQREALVGTAVHGHSGGDHSPSGDSLPATEHPQTTPSSGDPNGAVRVREAGDGELAKGDGGSGVSVPTAGGAPPPAPPSRGD